MTNTVKSKKQQVMSDKQTTFDRLCLLREWLRKDNPQITEAAIERKLGLATNYFNTRLNAPITKGSKGMREQTILNVKDAWESQKPDTPPLNISWLTNGEGDMFSETFPQKQKYGIPYFNEDFSQAEWFGDFQRLIPASYISLPPYNQKKSVCINYTGDSMSPTINNGDKVILQEIKNVKNVIYGEVYAIITNDGIRTIRRIIRSNDTEMFRLIPDGRESYYGDFQDIPICEIQQLFKVLCVIRNL